MPKIAALDPSRPPLQIICGQSAAGAAEAIVAAFRAIESESCKVSWVFNQLAHCIAMDSSHPLRVAGCFLAETIDSDAGISENPYHNSQHYCEVMLSTYFLALLATLSNEAAAELVLAAMMHDFRHDGKGNGTILFRLERNAVEAAKPFLVEAKVTPKLRRRLAALVLCTETSIGTKTMYGCYAHHCGGDSLPDIPADAPELAELCDDPGLTTQALILCEADLLPSIGLTVDYALRLQDKLAQEWKTQFGPEDKLRFIEQHCRPFIAGSFFNPNLERLAAALRESLHAKADLRQ